MFSDVMHHYIEIRKFYDFCPIMLAEVSQVCITTDDIISSNSIGQRKEIKVLRVANSF